MTTISLPDMLPVAVPADDVAGPAQGHWTYADYAAIPDDGQRYEVIGGTLYTVPSRNTIHQSAYGWFIYYFVTYIQLTGLGHTPVPSRCL